MSSDLEIPPVTKDFNSVRTSGLSFGASFMKSRMVISLVGPLWWAGITLYAAYLMGLGLVRGAASALDTTSEPCFDFQ